MRLDFGKALEALKQRERIYRNGWNGRNQWIEMIPDKFPMHPYFLIHLVDKTYATWVPSITDCLAEDWKISES